MNMADEIDPPANDDNDGDRPKQKHGHCFLLEFLLL